jgi:hypothetical protein
MQTITLLEATIYLQYQSWSNPLTNNQKQHWPLHIGRRYCGWGPRKPMVHGALATLQWWREVLYHPNGLNLLGIWIIIFQIAVFKQRNSIQTRHKAFRRELVFTWWLWLLNSFCNGLLQSTLVDTKVGCVPKPSQRHPIPDVAHCFWPGTMGLWSKVVVHYIGNWAPFGTRLSRVWCLQQGNCFRRESGSPIQEH